MIVATAGHVDHGKTSLVRALTGIDTDTLAEERRRGMTIDLGFAWAHLEGEGEVRGEPTTFVDVPGHERFLRNLLAGIAVVDAGLLVIAADDGPMPQTREHLAILTLLGLAPAAVALTKIDRVSPERRADAEREVAALLAGGPFAGAPVFGLVATTGEGVAPLRQHLALLARSLPAHRPGGHFRFAIDRHFTVVGAGRVVTGVALSGRVGVGDALVLSPEGAPVRVRGLQVRGRAVASAGAGQRVAINLAGSGNGLRSAEPARGDWLVAPAAHAPTSRIDVQLELLADAPRALASRGGLWLHLGAAAVPVRLVVLFASAIAPGGRGRAQLVLGQPVGAVQGEAFILRDPAAGRSVVAGGRVLDPFAPARGRARPARASFLAAMALPSPLDALARLSADAPEGVDLDRFGLARNLTPPDREALRQTLGLVELADADGRRWGLAAGRWQSLRERVRATLGAWHAETPDSVGPGEAALGERLGPFRDDGEWPGAPKAALLRAVLASLVAEGSVAREGLRLRLVSHRPVLSPADGALLARVTALLLPGGLRPPIVGDLAAGLGMPLPELLPALARSAALGMLVRVAPNRYFLPATVGTLADHARQLSAEAEDDQGRFEAAAYRDRTGIGRNLTVQVLEFLDREGVTRFDGSRRWAVAARLARAEADTPAAQAVPAAQAPPGAVPPA